MGEFTSFTDDNELSPDEDKKGSKEQDNRRRIPTPPLVPRSLELRREERVAEVTPPPPTLLEKVLGKEAAEASQDDNSEDDEDKKSEEAPTAAVEASSEDNADQAEPETVEAESAEQEPVESGESQAEQPLAAEQEQPALEEAPGEEPDEGILHIRRQPEPFAESASADSQEEDEAPAQAVAGGGSSTTTPPPPPPSTPAAAGFPNQGPSYNWNMAPPAPSSNFNTYSSTPAATSVEASREAKRSEEDAEKRGLRRGLIAGFITGYVVKAYLDGRKRERYEKATEKQLGQRDEQVARLQREQQELSRQMEARVEDYKRLQQEMTRDTKAQVEKARIEAMNDVPLEEQIFDDQGNRILLQPGWRVERSAGGYSVVLDEHNRVVHDAIHYGEAYKRDQKREQLSEDLFATVGGPSQAGGPADDYAAARVSGSVGQRPQAPSGDLPGQYPAADLNHRLPEPRNPIISTVASPWLWTAVAVIIIVYFIAALA